MSLDPIFRLIIDVFLAALLTVVLTGWYSMLASLFKWLINLLGGRNLANVLWAAAIEWTIIAGLIWFAIDDDNRGMPWIAYIFIGLAYFKMKFNHNYRRRKMRYHDMVRHDLIKEFDLVEDPGYSSVFGNIYHRD